MVYIQLKSKNQMNGQSKAEDRRRWGKERPEMKESTYIKKRRNMFKEEKEEETTVRMFIQWRKRIYIDSYYIVYSI